eukprot:7400022-Alexandrium_andersonii.AAC.1
MPLSLALSPVRPAPRPAGRRAQLALELGVSRAAGPGKASTAIVVPVGGPSLLLAKTPATTAALAMG